MTRISRARIDLEDGRVDNAFLKDYGETCVGGASGTNTTSTYTVDLESGNVFHLILSASCTFTFSNPPASATHGAFTLVLAQDGTGSRIATWPASVIWPSGTAPTLTTTASRYDTLNFTTFDAGVTWFGVITGYNFNLS